jgi:hypothetical protein
MGINDDWSYIWSARALADTGHIMYNGWATAILGWQLYLGALFISIFGFSFTIVRVPILLLAMAIAALLQRLFVRLGLNEWNAVLATLTLVLSPLFLPLSFMFMSDVPGLLCLLVCLYGCVRAVQASTDRAAIAWLAFATLTNVAGGTVRQIVWLGALVLVPATGWWIRRRRGALFASALLWCGSVFAILACMHWFSSQPYTVPEHVVQGSFSRSGILDLGISITRNSLALTLFALPVIIAFLFKMPREQRPSRRKLTAAACFLAVVAGVLTWYVHAREHRGESVREITPFGNNLVTARGILDMPVLLGHRPDVVPVWVRGVLLLLIFAGVLACVYVATSKRKAVVQQDKAPNALSRNAIITLLGPLTAAYVLLLVTRSQIYDRYLLPLFVIFLLLLVRLYQSRVASRLPVATVALLVLYAAFGVAGMHDLFAMERARLAAANELQSEGVPRDQFRAGFEYDAWTELERVGYVNEAKIRVPVGAYRPMRAPDLSKPCANWFTPYTPALQAHYALSYNPGVCSLSAFAPVPYQTWLAPHGRAIYIERLP